MEDVEGLAPILALMFTSSEKHKRSLASDLQQFGLLDAALYKSLTVAKRTDAKRDQKEAQQLPRDSSVHFSREGNLCSVPDRRRTEKKS